jgi:hypothetical protein
MGIKSMLAMISLSRAAAGVQSSPLSLPLEFHGKSLLVLLPHGQRELTIVKQILPEITAVFGDKDVYLLGSPTADIESIFPSKGFRIIACGKSSVTWNGLPSRSFLDKLKERRFDYVFDTNLEDNRFAARILLCFPQAVRFGKNGHLGLPYLNLEVKTRFLRDRRQIYRSILEVVANLALTAPHHADTIEEKPCT